jgi:hypothetical protein
MFLSYPSINNKNRRRTMKTKNIFKVLALAMLMPAMLLTTACSSDDDFEINNEKTETVAQKDFAIPVTVNVTCEDDDATTRATYNESTHKLGFSKGDKLFVSGLNTSASVNTGWFAGTLEWQSGGTFSGTIYTQNEYTGSVDALLAGTTMAVLLPAGYEDYGFLEVMNEGSNMLLDTDYAKAFAASKAAGVEQFSLEWTNKYSSGFALKPRNAILNFTINGLKPSADVNVIFTNDKTDASLVIYKKVKTDGSGTATFAVGVLGGIDIKRISLRVDGNAINLPSSKKLEAGHIYNITRRPVLEGAISGKFTINGNGDKVFFAKGNLQATTTDNCASWTWAFATNQWDYVGNAVANNAINGNGTVSTNGTVDLFGWSTNTTYYGIYNSTYADNYGYSDFKDWGPTMGSGWRTPSVDEWNYVLKTRSASTVNGTAHGRFAKATVADKAGLIIFPDWYRHPDGVTRPRNVNIDNCDYNVNTYDATAWSEMEDAGCVFLPAAGYREGTSMSYVGSGGYYWSSTKFNHDMAEGFSVASSNVDTEGVWVSRHYGYSVRLIHAVE